ncbi:Ferric-chelate reductase (NADH) [Bertholletia excelsa]
MDSMAVKRAPTSHGHGGRMKVLRRATMGLMMVVFLGYLMMWVVSACKIYRTWFLKLHDSTNSTYFEWQGTRILINAFPVLFIAVLGCVYLHLGENLEENGNQRESNGKTHKFVSWKRPMIVKGLGIVSWIELTLFAMFIALLVWGFSAYLVRFFSEADRRAIEKGDKVWEAKLDRAGLTLGFVGNICLAFLFFPVTRRSPLLPLLGLTSESSLKYHIWLGHITMVLFALHGVLYIIYWIVTNRPSEMLKWNPIEVSNVAGEISLLSGLLLWATTHPRIRQKAFELFFYTHYLYVLFMVFYVYHLGISYTYTVLPGFYLFLLDRFLRFLQSRGRCQLVSSRVLPGSTLELSFSKSRALSYTPTSIIFINVPSISKLQWHPFTISSSSNLEPDRLSLIIKKEGSWTNKLYDMLSSPSTIDHLDVSVEGPYGPVSTHFLRHDMVVMVSGGSGIAPFMSIIKEFIFTRSTLKTKTPQLLLVSAFKYSSDLTMLDLLLPSSPPAFEDSNLDLQVEAYVTREIEPPLEKPQILRTIWFNPNTSNMPISPILGPTAWLWLGVIVSSSFVVFLLLMGILTRFYIYPIDHNTNRIYSHTSQATLNMILICISIAMAASAAFLWNKRQTTREAKQMWEASTGSWPGDDREMQSLSYRFPSIGKSIKVHYGGRPELRKILLEQKDPSVGVLVCGPRSMRHEVAAICSSGQTENLHFESISFSW